jgi:UDP-glucuronate 4-epimerase
VALDSFTPYYSPELKRARAQRLRDAGIEVVEGDLCDEARLVALIAQHGVTHIASMAAQAGVRYSLSNPQSYVRSNVQCFISLLEALRATPHVPLIYASSSSVYGSNTKAPFAESDRVDSPNSLYAATKKANEAIAHVYHGLYGLRLTGLRFFTVYGPWGRPDMAYFSFTRRIEQGLPIQVYGHGKPKRDFTYVDDIVDGVVAALALGAPEEIFNLGNHRSESLLRFIQILETELGKKANRTMVPMAPGDVLATYADIRHARDKLGYYPKTRLEDGLHKFMAWYRSADYRPEFAEGGDWLKPPAGKGKALAGQSAAGAAVGVQPRHRQRAQVPPELSSSS